jgi:hypothetical protein
MASATAYGTLTWRGLRISFSAEGSWRRAVPVAAISAGSASLPVKLNEAWTTKGQHWRIEKEIRSHAGGVADAAERLRTEIQDLRQRAADATRRIDEPFPQAADLEAARARRDAIEQDIRDAAAPQDGSTAPASGQDDDLVAAAHDALAMAGMNDAPEITFAAAMVSPETAVLIEDISEADRPFAPAAATCVPAPAPAGDDSPGVAVPVSPGEQARARPGRGEPPGQRPAIDGVTPAETPPSEPAAAPLPVTHPVQPARLDGVVEPLFPLPAVVPASPDAEQVSRPPRPRRARRKASQSAACDNPVQPALFDLPPPLIPVSRRPTTPDRSRTQAPRK